MKTSKYTVVFLGLIALGVCLIAVFCIYYFTLIKIADSGVSSERCELTKLHVDHPRHPVVLAIESLRLNASNRIMQSTAPFTSVLGENAKDYRGCIAALRNLPLELNAQQVDDLRSLTAFSYSPATGVSLLEFNGIKNDVASILLQQKDFPADIIADFAVQFENPEQDEVWRDYCIQMLSIGYLNLGKRTDDDQVAPIARELALEVLMTASSDTQGVARGTALLGLNTILSSEPDAFPREELDNRILSVLSGSSSDKAAQLTATRLAGLNRLESSRPMLENLSRSSSVLLRNAAAKSLSELDEL